MHCSVKQHLKHLETREILYIRQRQLHVGECVHQLVISFSDMKLFFLKKADFLKFLLNIE